MVRPGDRTSLTVRPFPTSPDLIGINLNKSRLAFFFEKLMVNYTVITRYKKSITCRTGENHINGQYYLHMSKKSSTFVADLE